MDIKSAPQHAAPKRRIWPWVLVGLALIVFAIGSCGSHSTTPTAAPANVAPAPTLPMPIVPLPAPAPAQAPAGTVTDGTYAPGELTPGTYHTNGSHTGSVPYAIIKDGNDNIVKVIQVDGPVTLKILKGQAFETHGGVTWELQKAASSK